MIMTKITIGLEIHQQLEGRKLFSHSPTIISEGEFDKVIIRKLSAVVGETGEIDIAAKHEKHKNKTFEYHFYNESNCLVDTDEEPPHKTSEEALKTIFLFSRLCKSNIVDAIQFMRKLVIDGSNTSGFQRTSLVATGGFLEVNKNKIGIQSICLEEDSAKIVSRKENKDTYNLSRLGIPLIEIATSPDITSGEQAKDVAMHIGMLLRSLNVKRGLGTIRQDINISIDGGQRVEIKGAQDIKLIPEIVEQEVNRQKSLNELKTLNFKNDSVITDLTEIFKDCDSKVVNSKIDFKKEKEDNGKVLGIKVSGFKGFIGKEIQKERRLGSELSDYAKLRAGVGGIFHSDELPNYGITNNEISKINKKLDMRKDDAFILVVDKNKTAKLALEAVIDRLKLLKDGVLPEVRNALPNGSSTYLRPMPGSARMYPETDIPLIVVDHAKVASLELPKPLTEKVKELEKDLSNDLANLIVKEGKYDLFKKFSNRYKNIKPAFIAETIEPKLLELKRDYNIDVTKITEHNLDMIFNKLDKNLITKESIDEILKLYGNGKNVNFEDFKPLDNNIVEKEIKKIVKDNKGAPIGALMGKAMAKFSGKVDGKKVSEIIKKLIK